MLDPAVHARPRVRRVRLFEQLKQDLSRQLNNSRISGPADLSEQRAREGCVELTGLRLSVHSLCHARINSIEQLESLSAHLECQLVRHDWKAPNQSDVDRCEPGAQ